jgi:S-adenosylmethionine:diacylglycerol 3-amino-3-carboxypropyl transferase
LKKESPYNFGISQEDALTESKGLDLKTGDSLLCIASGGEIPLNILALYDVKIVACDTSIEQIYLSKLKLASVLHLSRDEAAKLIGLYNSSDEERLDIYKKLSEHLSDEEKTFWNKKEEAIEKGVVNVARFEKYILKFSWVLRLLLGKRKLKKLMLLETPEEQRDYFDKKISNWWIKLLFKIAFHPKIYKNRGMDEHGLQHQKDASVATFFFNRFRDFCTSTLASDNYYFQYTFFNEILNEDALPEYLSEEGIRNIRANQSNLTWIHADFTSVLRSSKQGTYNKLHLSNIGDWLSAEQMNEVFQAIHDYAADDSKMVIRYIHRNHQVPERFADAFQLNVPFGEELVQTDRYPFYHVIPGSFKRQ